MGFYDNGGMIGKVPNYDSQDYQFTESTLQRIIHVGSLTGTLTPNATGISTVSLSSLLGGIDSVSAANDVVVVSYSFCGYPSYTATTWSTANTSTADAVSSVMLGLKPANTTQQIVFQGAVTANITGSTATTTLVNLPANTSANDVVVITYAIASSVSRQAQINLSGQGYTNVVITSQTDTNFNTLGVVYKVMGATPNTNVTIPATGATGSAGSVAIQVFRYVDNVSPLGNTATATDNTASTRRPTFTAIIVPEKPGVMVVHCASAAHTGGTAETGFTNPDSLGGFVTTTSDGTTYDSTVGMGYKLFNANDFISYTSAVQNCVTLSGYTNIKTQHAIGSGGIYPYITAHSVQYKVMSSTPDSSVVFPVSGRTTFAGTYNIQVWRYVDTSNVLDVPANSYTFGYLGGNNTYYSLTGTEQPYPAAITTQTANAVVCVFGVTGAGTSEAYTNITTYGQPLDFFYTSWLADTTDSTSGAWAYTPGAANTLVNFGSGDAFLQDGANSPTSSSASVTAVLRPKTRTVRSLSSSKKNNSGMWNNSARFYSKKNSTASYANIVDKTGVSVSPYSGALGNYGTLKLPNTIKANDLILVIGVSDTDTLAALYDNTTYKPSGFTLINYNRGGSAGGSSARTGAHLAAFYKIANGTEGGTTITLPSSSSAAQGVSMCAIIIRDADLTSPVGNIGQGVGVNAGSTTVPGIISTKNNSIIFTVLGLESALDLPVTTYTVNPDLFYSTDAWGEIQNSIIGGINASDPGLMVKWKQLKESGDASNYHAINFGGTGYYSAFQFEIKSAN